MPTPQADTDDQPPVPDGWIIPLSEDGPSPEDNPEEWRLSAAAAQILLAEGPLAEADLTGHLLSVGIATDDLPTSVWEIWDVYPLRDGRVANLASLAEGRTFTHPLSPGEVDEQRLPLRDDLGLFLTFIPPALTLATGGHADIRMWKGPWDLDKSTSLFGPSGWLGDAVTDDLLAVTLTDGVLSLETIARETLPDEHSDEVAQSLRQTFEALEARNLNGGPLDVPELLIETIARHPESFVTPVEPVSSLLERVDLFEEDDGAVLDLTGEFEFAADDPSPVQDIYGLDDHGVDALDDLHDAVHVRMNRAAVNPGSDTEDVNAEDVDAPSEDPEGVRNNDFRHEDALPTRALLAALRYDDRVALALADEVLGVHDDGAADLLGLIELLEPDATAEGRVPLLFLRARCAEHQGDPHQAVHHLDAAVRLDPEHPDARVLLARFAEVRGDSATALGHLRRLGVSGEDPDIVRLTRWARLDKQVARNALCPCGSGRKYKLCHQGQGGPLAGRVGWILDKAAAYANQPMFVEHLVGLTMGEGEVDALVEHAAIKALGDPTIGDVALFEGGLFAQFLFARGALLPEDERELARQWLDAPRGVYEIAAVEPGDSLELLDVRSGERHTVTERTATQELLTGEVLFARLLPDGTGLQLSGGSMRVPVGHRASLLALFDTPSVEPSSVEPSASAHSTSQSLPTAEQICAWVVGFFTPPRVVLPPELEARLEEGDLEPGPDDAVPFDPDHPPADVVELMDRMTREHETRWVDEPVPMFGNATPRQALADPTRRADVLAFLEEMARPEHPGVMSAARIRVLLGLPESD